MIWRVWSWGKCAHRHTRCVHGDEILRTLDWMGRIKRQACIECSRYLDRDMLDVCTQTGKPHIKEKQ